MSLETVRAFLAEKAPDIAIVELPTSSQTMTLSAAWGLKPAQIAKALALRVADGRGDAHGGRVVLLMACGDSRIDNKKAKAAFGGKAKMLPPDEAAAITGHPVGGVSPFGLATPLPVYCDVMLKAYDVVVPAAGSTHAAMRIHPLRMAELAGARWVDVCEGRQPSNT